MKKILIVILCVFIYACHKEDLNTYREKENTDQNYTSFRLNLAPPSYRGVYVDNFHLIVGDTAKENKLLRWCKKYNFNAISTYDNETVFQNGLNTKLAKFIKKSKTSTYGIVSVASVRGYYQEFSPNKTTNGVNNYSSVYYNNNRIDTLEKFNTFNLENEWWNATNEIVAFVDYSKTLKYMYSKAKLANHLPLVKSELYIGWLTTGYQKYQVGVLIDNTDRILVHDYEIQPSFSYLKSRLDTLGSVAKTKNKIVNVIIIFSAESLPKNNFMGPYYSTHTFQEPYEDIVNQYYLSTTFTKYGSNINIIGYQVFTYSIINKIKI